MIGKYATLEELETHYSIDDIFALNDALDILAEQHPK